MKKKERRERMLTAGDELAHSGKCSDWRDVEARLRGEHGYSESETRDWTQDTRVKNRLNEICKAAQSTTSH